jgi:Na+-translocating ferredoxin:NAD+ oxidoreductase RNF subunit RnfB
MLTTVLVCVCCLGVLGTAFGIGLAVASKRFHVDVDPKIDEVYEALPGGDCGACGCAGCAGFATAVVKGEAPLDGCVPGGAECARAVAAVMGVALEGERKPGRAVVHCQGGLAEARSEFEYDGVEDCRSAKLIHGGPKACKHGCLGFGTCASVCPFDAITMSPNGLPVVSEEKCTGCGLCAKACPVGIISILPSEQRVFLGCSNPGKGKALKEQCAVGCISCRLCVKATESGAIQWGDGLPSFDYEKGEDFDAAIEKCPMGCFVDQRAAGVAAESPS